MKDKIQNNGKLKKLQIYGEKGNNNNKGTAWHH